MKNKPTKYEERLEKYTEIQSRKGRYLMVFLGNVKILQQEICTKQVKGFNEFVSKTEKEYLQDR